MKIAIKSVPPLVAPAKRQKLTATELSNPPKIAESKISSVTFITGRISVKSPERKIIKQE